MKHSCFAMLVKLLGYSEMMRLHNYDSLIFLHCEICVKTTYYCLSG